MGSVFPFMFLNTQHERIKIHHQKRMFDTATMFLWPVLRASAAAPFGTQCRCRSAAAHRTMHVLATVATWATLASADWACLGCLGCLGSRGKWQKLW